MTKLFTKPGCIDCENAICDECDSENQRATNVVTAAFGKPAPSVDDGGPYVEGPVKCLRCKHEWHGVAPAGVPTGLECPSCGCFAGARMSVVQPAGERWVCSCEGQLFFLDRLGPPMCAGCGLRAHEWVDAS